MGFPAEHIPLRRHLEGSTVRRAQGQPSGTWSMATPRRTWHAIGESPGEIPYLREIPRLDGWKKRPNSQGQNPVDSPFFMVIFHGQTTIFPW